MGEPGLRDNRPAGQQSGEPHAPELIAERRHGQGGTAPEQHRAETRVPGDDGKRGDKVGHRLRLGKIFGLQQEPDEPRPQRHGETDPGERFQRHDMVAAQQRGAEQQGAEQAEGAGHLHPAEKARSASHTLASIATVTVKM